MYLVFTRMPGESYRRRFRSLLLYYCDVFRVLINSLVCWFCTSALGLVLFQIYNRQMSGQISDHSHHSLLMYFPSGGNNRMFASCLPIFIVQRWRVKNRSKKWQESCNYVNVCTSLITSFIIMRKDLQPKAIHLGQILSRSECRIFQPCPSSSVTMRLGRLSDTDMGHGIEGTGHCRNASLHFHSGAYQLVMGHFSRTTHP